MVCLKLQTCDAWIFPIQDALSYQLDLHSISTIHDLMHRYETRFPESSKGLRYFVRERRFKRLVKYSEKILVDSELGKRQVIDSYQGVEDRIIPLPYVTNISNEMEMADEVFEMSYDLPDKFMFYPAQFWKHKNHENLIKAVERVAKNNPDISVVLTGSKDREYDNISALVEASNLQDNIYFTGFIPDAALYHFYKRARFLIMPTYFGPTNIPPLEALSLNCPMALSNNYAMPEQAKNAALYFHPDNIDEMSIVISKLWNDDDVIKELKKFGEIVRTGWTIDQFSERLDFHLRTLQPRIGI